MCQVTFWQAGDTIDKFKMACGARPNYFQSLESLVSSLVVSRYEGFMVSFGDSFLVNSGSFEAVTKEYTDACVTAQELVWKLREAEFLFAGFQKPNSNSLAAIRRSKHCLCPYLKKPL